MRKLSALNITSLLVLVGAAAVLLYVVIKSNPRESEAGQGEAPTAETGETPAPEPTVVQLVEQIAFVSDRDGNFEIYSMTTDGGNQTRLTHHEGMDGVPTWSPDGSRIAFISDRDGSQEIYVMNSDGSNPTRLTTSQMVELNLRWSPDGSQIAYITSLPGAMNTTVEVISASGGDPVIVGKAPFSAPVWSPDSLSLAFTVYEPRNDGTALPVVQIARLDDISGMMLTTDGMSSDHPAWSPDGTRIAFSGVPDPTTNLNLVYIADLSGAAPVQPITEDPRQIQSISWSPDGQRIAFLAWNDGGLVDLYVMNADGSNLTVVYTATEGLEIEWSPDGAYLVMQTQTTDPVFVIVRIAADGSGAQEITDHSSNSMMPDWSPVGVLMAAPPQIAIVEDGGTPTPPPPPTALTAEPTGEATVTPSPTPEMSTGEAPLETYFNVLEEEFWSTAPTDQNSGFVFGARMSFDSAIPVSVLLLGFPLYADEQMPDPNFCVDSNGSMPPEHPDRPFWSSGFPYEYEPGHNDHVEEYLYDGSGSGEYTGLIGWLVVRNPNGVVIYCSQHLYSLTGEE